MTTMMIKAMDISPVHEVEDAELYSQLVADMYRNGWTGRPLLAAEVNGEICALTGSHRVAAARHNDLEVPVYFVQLSAAQIDRCFEGFQDDKLAVLKEVGDIEAIALFVREIKEGR